MYTQRLKEIRSKLKYTVEELAEIIEIPARTLGSYLRGERTCSLDVVTQLYNKLNINANWFVSGEGEMFVEDTKKDEELENLVSQIVDKKMKERGLL